MAIILAVVSVVCRAVFIRQAYLRRAVQTAVTTSAPETATVVMENIRNNTSQAPPALNPSAAYGGYTTPAGNTAPPSNPATGYPTTGLPFAPPPYPS